MIPTLTALMDAQNAINRQFPALAGIPAGEGVDVHLTARDLATIACALGVTSSVVREGVKPSPSQIGWAAIIDGALVARGAPHLERPIIDALERCKVDELERMAELVLAAGLTPAAPAAPDTPETVAAKAGAARRALHAFDAGHTGGHEAAR